MKKIKTTLHNFWQRGTQTMTNLRVKTLVALPDLTHLSGLGCGVAAAWVVSLPLGLLALGIVLFLVGTVIDK